MNIIKWIIKGVGIAAVLLVLTSIAVAVLVRQTTNTDSGGKVAAPADPLLVQTWDWKRGQYGNQSIVGIVKNTTAQSFTYAQVEFTLYDKAGNQVGTALANINNLEPYGTWKFEAGVLQADASKARLKGTTSF